MCIRCALESPAVKEVSSVDNNAQILAALIKRWDKDYEKALERKKTKEGKRKPPITKPAGKQQKKECFVTQTDKSPHSQVE